MHILKCGQNVVAKATYMNIVPLSFLLHEISTDVELEPKNLIHDGVLEEEKSLAILDGRSIHLQNLQLQQVLILNRTLKLDIFRGLE